MKHLLIITFSFLLTFNLTAQSVKFKGEKVLVDKELYGYLEKGGNGMSAWTYSIKNLEKEELLFLKSNTVEVSEGNLKAYMTVTVSETEETFEVEYFLGFKKDFIRKLYKYEVIKDNKINEDGLKKYKRTYAGNFQEQYEKEANRAVNSAKIINDSNSNNTTDYIIVKRNTNGNIFVINGKIKQQNVEIATYETDSEATDGKIIKTVKIYNINNQLVAQLQYENFEKEVTIITLKDNKKHQVISKMNIDNDKVKASMELLIEYLYI